jgi:hypothetical protein
VVGGVIGSAGASSVGQVLNDLASHRSLTACLGVATLLGNILGGALSEGIASKLSIRTLPQGGQDRFGELCFPWMGTMVKVGFSAALTPTFSPTSVNGPRIAAFVW